MLCIIEDLTVRTFMGSVLPRLQDLRKAHPGNKRSVYYIDVTPWALRWAKLVGRWLGIEFMRLEFRLVDIFADDGDLARLKAAYTDLAQVLSRITCSDEFQDIVKQAAVQDQRIGSYLAKQAVVFIYHDANTLLRLLYLVYLARWKTRHGDGPAQPVVLFVKRRMWMDEVKDFIRGWGVELEPVPLAWDLKKKIIALFGGEKLRPLLYLLRGYGIQALFAKRRCLLHADCTANAFIRSASACRIMVEYNGHLNIDKPEMYSDLFFAQQSGFRREDVLVTFNYPRDAFDQVKADLLEAFHASAVGLNPKATRFSRRGVFHYAPSPCRRKLVVGKRFGRSEEVDWLETQTEHSRAQAAYWRAFFQRFQVRVYLSWYKYDARHMIIADVLQELGGVSALYQRAFESGSSPETAVDVDLFFGFSSEAARIEEASGSRVPYYIVTGYNGDHRFQLVEPKALQVREQLLRNGAKRIIAFFDENSGADPRWHYGHKFMSLNYEFLLRKALEDRTLGLVFKPKVPGDLRKRLGPVAELLKDLESQGRCFVFQTGVTHGSYPPVVAAKAADIAIHGHLCAATAGIEAALAGIPTVLMDCEGWPSCSLYANGAEGKIIFRSWDRMWFVLQEHWKRPGGVPGFADWSGLLEQLDPFRDGRAAERTGTFLSWVMEGLRAGHSREKVLADAARRYADMWGKDKVIAVDGVRHRTRVGSPGKAVERPGR